MDLEVRVEALEAEVEALKGEIREILLCVRANLSQMSDNSTPSSRGWQKRAWAGALLNLLLAIVLFTNTRFYLPETLLERDSPFVPWLRAFWIALAFVWLVLQLYPLRFLFEQEEVWSRDIVWRSVMALLKSNSGVALGVTLLIFLVAVVSVLAPSLWLVMAVVLLAAVCVSIINYFC